MQSLVRTKELTHTKALLLLGAVLGIAGCTTVPTTTHSDEIAVGDSQFCAVAQDKATYVGKDLVLRGSYVTDLRHYSMLQATCNGKNVGFGLGNGPAELSLSDPRVRDECEIACHIVVDAVITGKLVERGGVVDLDFSKMVLPDDFAR